MVEAMAEGVTCPKRDIVCQASGVSSGASGSFVWVLSSASCGDRRKGALMGKSRMGYRPMWPVIFEAAADEMLLRHAERVALCSTMLEALAENQPVRWGLIVEGMQDIILSAYDSGSIRVLAEALDMVENMYLDIVRSSGMDPDTGKMR